MAEQKAKKRSVGLVVLTDIPGMGVVAVLRRRGKINPEKDDFHESYPGGCQVTCHGKVKPEDDKEDEALLREAGEEIGQEAAHKLLVQNRGRLTVLVDDREANAVTFGIFMPDPDFIHLIRLEVSSGGLELLPQSEIGNIRDLLRDFDKRTGVTDTNVIAMFPDEIKAVRLAFEILAPAS